MPFIDSSCRSTVYILSTLATDKPIQYAYRYKTIRINIVGGFDIFSTVGRRRGFSWFTFSILTTHALPLGRMTAFYVFSLRCEGTHRFGTRFWNVVFAAFLKPWYLYSKILNDHNITKHHRFTCACTGKLQLEYSQRRGFVQLLTRVRVGEEEINQVRWGFCFLSNIPGENNEIVFKPVDISEGLKIRVNCYSDFVVVTTSSSVYSRKYARALIYLFAPSVSTYVWFSPSLRKYSLTMVIVIIYKRTVTLGVLILITRGKFSSVGYT